MSNSWIQDHSTLGRISFSYHARAKRLTLRVHPSKGVVVTVPRGVSQQYAENFVETKVSWIEKTIQKTPNYSLQITPQTVPMLPGHEWAWKPNEPFKVGLRQGRLTIRYEKQDLLEESKQDILLKGVLRCWRKQAETLESRLELFSVQSGISYKQLRFKNMTSRWGSCSHQGNINISIFVAGLPTVLQDYILWHELTHIVHPNHSSNFWNTLEELYPGAYQYDKQMKQYHTNIWMNIKS